MHGEANTVKGEKAVFVRASRDQLPNQRRKSGEYIAVAGDET
jgi:hypothetical protein